MMSPSTGAQQDIEAPMPDLSRIQSVAAAPNMLSVKALLKAQGMTANMAQRIQEADSDGNGLLTVEEVLRVFQNEQVLAAEKRVMRAYMKRTAIAMSVFLLLMCAAMVGLVYAVVYMSKDTAINSSSGLMVVKGGSAPVLTGAVAMASNISSLHKASVAQVQGLQSLVMANPGGGYTVYAVSQVSVDPGRRADILTTSGVTFQVDDSGVHRVVEGQGGGRRLLEVSTTGQYTTNNDCIGCMEYTSSEPIMIQIDDGEYLESPSPEPTDIIIQINDGAYLSPQPGNGKGKGHGNNGSGGSPK